MSLLPDIGAQTSQHNFKLDDIEENSAFRVLFDPIGVSSRSFRGAWDYGFDSGDEMNAEQVAEESEGRIKLKPDETIRRSTYDLRLEDRKHDIEQEVALLTTKNDVASGAAALSAGLVNGILDPINFAIAGLAIVAPPVAITLGIASKGKWLKSLSSAAHKARLAKTTTKGARNVEQLKYHGGFQLAGNTAYAVGVDVPSEITYGKDLSLMEVVAGIAIGSIVGTAIGVGAGRFIDSRTVKKTQKTLNSMIPETASDGVFASSKIIDSLVEVNTILQKRVNESYAINNKELLTMAKSEGIFRYATEPDFRGEVNSRMLNDMDFDTDGFKRHNELKEAIEYDTLNLDVLTPDEGKIFNDVLASVHKERSVEILDEVGALLKEKPHVSMDDKAGFIDFAEEVKKMEAESKVGAKPAKGAVKDTKKTPEKTDIEGDELDVKSIVDTKGKEIPKELTEELEADIAENNNAIATRQTILKECGG